MPLCKYIERTFVTWVPEYEGPVFSSSWDLAIFCDFSFISNISSTTDSISAKLESLIDHHESNFEENWFTLSFLAVSKFWKLKNKLRNTIWHRISNAYRSTLTCVIFMNLKISDMQTWEPLQIGIWRRENMNFCHFSVFYYEWFPSIWLYANMCNIDKNQMAIEFLIHQNLEYWILVMIMYHILF